MMPPGMTHEQHMALMKQHGQTAMGFDQDKATHHFTLTTNGGTIEVTVVDPADQVTHDEIQTHLREIAAAFGRGDFEKPLLTHGEVPPGSQKCNVTRMRSRIHTQVLRMVGSCESQLQMPMR